jgi:hypothetical protein
VAPSSFFSQQDALSAFGREGLEISPEYAILEHATTELQKNYKCIFIIVKLTFLFEEPREFLCNLSNC